MLLLSHNFSWAAELGALRVKIYSRLVEKYGEDEGKVGGICGVSDLENLNS